MPTYAYACENCGHEFEEFQSIKAAPLRKCPQCKKLTLKRLIGTGAAIIFKGSGFYATDYRSDSYKKAAEKDSGVPTKSTDKKDAKPKATPAEPATKTDKPSKKKPT
jgi:putative FmdB family regulatory protein